MPHGDAVIHGDGIELDSVPTIGVDNRLHPLTNVMEMDVTWYELRERVGNGNDRLPKVLGFHTGGSPQRPRPGHPTPLSSDTAAKSALLHDVTLLSTGLASIPTQSARIAQCITCHTPSLPLHLSIAKQGGKA
jgi:hypothetical protein